MHQRTATLEPTSPSATSRARAVITAYIAAAFAISSSGAIAAVPPLVPLCAFGVILASVLAYRARGGFRALVDRIPLRWAMLAHTIRVPIGLYILVETQRGDLPELFGLRAGPGDVAVGGLAILALLALPAATRARRALVFAWCLAGIVDLAVAFGTAQYLLWVIGDLRMMTVAELPWALLPTLIVPGLLLLHLYVMARIRGTR